ncbi:MAG TPA: TonB-dependent receptor plug domain-containing protein [Gemmatimonadaceae bacterium]|jgi:TonB-dependent SusC/RagA subfamily outer membrane receptor
MSRPSLILVIVAITACGTPRFTHPAVVPTTDERVALGFPHDVLYVLDGHVLPRGDSASVPTAVRNLDPSTIETIQVLKGASAKRAYGDAGASGVVIIKTKNSRTGGGA